MDRVPDNAVMDVKVLMSQPVAHSDYPLPWDFRGTLADVFRDVASSFSNIFDFLHDGKLGPTVTAEFLKAHTFEERRALFAGV